MYRAIDNLTVMVAAVLVATACKPSEPPPDIIKTQRDAMQKSKGVEGQLEQAAEEQKKAADEAAK
jgi:outer membrane PBP1 activator LpoA protein